MHFRNRKTIALIPSRMESSRLFGKPLLPMGRYPMIVHVALRTKLAKKVDEVVVCTDSDDIVRVCERYRIDCCLTQSTCLNGTERIHDAKARLKLGDDDLIIDVQGDEPLISPTVVDDIVTYVQTNWDPSRIYLPHVEGTQECNKNIVKVVASDRRVLYLTRADSPYPYSRINPLKKHLSVIGFSGLSLANYMQLPTGVLEQVEGVELLRALEGGMEIETFKIESDSFSVDVVDDYEKAKIFIELDPLYSGGMY